MSMNRRQGSWRGFLMTSLIAAAVQSRAAGDDKPAAPASDAPAATAAPKEGGVLLASTNGPSPTIQLTLDDVPLAEVVKLFTRVSGANIIAASTNLQGSVTANLQGVPWRPALESILQRQGLMLSENPPGSNVFVIEKLQEGVEPRASETIVLNYAKVDDVARLLQSVLGDSATGSNSVDRMVTAFPAGNIIVIRAPAMKINEAHKIIESVDKPRTQVYIEAKFVELTDDASKKLGIDWSSLDSYNVIGGISFKNVNGNAYGLDVVSDGADTANHAGSGIGTIAATALGAGGRTRLRNVTSSLTPDDFKVVLSALESTDGSKVIYNPKIMVANEQNATIKVVTDEPNVNVTRTAATVTGSTDSYATSLDSTRPFFTYGITLDVTPRVNTSSNITVTIKPEISTHAPTEKAVRSSDSTAAAIATYPIISKKTVDTTFSLADGHTAVIGGLIQIDNQDADSKIPLLGSIPWIGPRFFGYKSHTQTKSELVIFVTVAIVDPQTITQSAGLPQMAELSRREIQDTKAK